jgi:general secretion pathway protein G
MLQRIKAIQERRAIHSEEGFTLIELLIVIVVLGILAAVVVFALGSVTGNAKASACNADAKTVTTAVQAFDAQNSPASISWETVGTGAVGSGTILPSDWTTFVNGAQAQRLLTIPTGGTTPYLNAWPSNTNNNYAIALATGPATVAGSDAAGSTATAPVHAGDVMVYVKINGTTTISDYNNETQAANSGCNAL